MDSAGYVSSDGASELITLFCVFRLQISCTIKSTPSRNRNIPIIVRVSDVNDNTPVFVNAPYETTIAEVS